MQTPEYLRQQYNQNFSEPCDRWSDTDMRRTGGIARRVVAFMARRGYRPGPGARMLDVGCAKGFFNEAFRRRGFDAHGLDISDVAIGIARRTFPRCTFFCADGFTPQLGQTFDLIFMKGFSGTNSHNLQAVAAICHRYAVALNPSGWLVVSYTTDFSGVEQEGETVNWSRDEIVRFARMVDGTCHVSTEYLGYGVVQKAYRAMLALAGVRRKHSFYIFLRRGEG